MALSFGNTVTTDFKRTDSGSGATSLAVDLPSVSAGELLVVVIYHDDNAGTFSTPSGWNSYTGGSVNTVTSFGCTAILWKTAAGGETSVTVSKSGGIGAYIQAYALRITGGHDTTTPINVGSLVDASGGSNWNSPSITTTVDNTLNFWHGGSNGASSWTTGDEPNSSTFIDTGATASSRVMIAYEAQTTAGATGTKQFTNTANAKRALSFAIAPAAAASGLPITMTGCIITGALISST